MPITSRSLEMMGWRIARLSSLQGCRQSPYEIQAHGPFHSSFPLPGQPAAAMEFAWIEGFVVVTGKRGKLDRVSAAIVR
jgi:hypothetical protein